MKNGNKTKISNKVIPYHGYDKGWNVILYDDSHHTIEDAIELLRIFNYEDERIADIINLIGDGGYCVLENRDEEELPALFELMIDTIRHKGFQCELFYEDDTYNFPNV